MGACSPWVTDCSLSVWDAGTPRPGMVDFNSLDLNNVLTIVDLPRPL